ncbi:6191_t:CDS:2, partial [Gigaspora margarita]
MLCDFKSQCFNKDEYGICIYKMVECSSLSIMDVPVDKLALSALERHFLYWKTIPAMGWLVDDNDANTHFLFYSGPGDE